MARTGQKNQSRITGMIAYGHDGTDSYAIDVASRKLRTSATPFLFDIADGVISGYAAVNKFGHNGVMATTYEDIWDGSSLYTYSAAATTMYISSSDAGDTQDILVEGLDGLWGVQSVTQALAGTAKTTIGTGETWLRIYRMANAGSTDIAGTVYAYESDTLTAGVPDTATKIRAEIIGSNNQTLMAMWTVPVACTAYMESIHASTPSSKLVTAALFVRPYGGVFQIKHIDVVDKVNNILPIPGDKYYRMSWVARVVGVLCPCFKKR